MVEEPPSAEEMLAQFNRLIRELMRGRFTRNTFQPWEVALLLDVESCNLKDASKDGILRRYQKAVQRQVEKGSGTFMLLSEFLGRKS